MAFRRPSVELTAGKSYILCLVHLLVIYIVFLSFYCLGKDVDFFFIFAFSKTGGLIFA